LIATDLITQRQLAEKWIAGPKMHVTGPFKGIYLLFFCLVYPEFLLGQLALAAVAPDFFFGVLQSPVGQMSTSWQLTTYPIYTFWTVYIHICKDRKLAHRMTRYTIIFHDFVSKLASGV